MILHPQDGMTPLDLAAKAAKTAVVEILGGDVSADMVRTVRDMLLSHKMQRCT